MQRTLRKVPNWNAAGPDGIKGFWIKNFTSLHVVIAVNLQQCLETGAVPKWMTSDRKTLIRKDPAKATQAGDYRRITSLSLMWKTSTEIIADKLNKHLAKQDVIGDEQKGCIRKTRDTKDHLMLGKVTLCDSKRRSTN